MVMFTNIPPLVAGTDWSITDVQTFIVDNLNALHAIAQGGTPGQNFAVNEVIYGGVGGVLLGLAVGVGELIRGTAGAPESFGPPAAGQVLGEDNGVPTYVMPDFTGTLSDYVKYK